MKSKLLLDELMRLKETHESIRTNSEWLHYNSQAHDSNAVEDLKQVKTGFQKFLIMTKIGDSAVELVL